MQAEPYPPPRYGCARLLLPAGSGAARNRHARRSCVTTGREGASRSASGSPRHAMSWLSVRGALWTCRQSRRRP